MIEPAGSVEELLERVDWIPVFGPWPESYGLYATHMGWMDLGGHQLQVYILNDGQKVFDADSVSEVFGDE